MHRVWVCHSCIQLSMSSLPLPSPLSSSLRLRLTGWGIVDFDWSNAKDVWAKSKPMNCEEMLVEQVRVCCVWWTLTVSIASCAWREWERLRQAILMGTDLTMAESACPANVLL
jgi:hypothetical protein